MADVIPNMNTELYGLELVGDEDGLHQIVERPIVGWTMEVLEGDEVLVPLSPGWRGLADLVMDKMTGLVTRMGTGDVFMNLESALDVIAPGSASRLVHMGVDGQVMS